MIAIGFKFPSLFLILFCFILFIVFFACPLFLFFFQYPASTPRVDAIEVQCREFDNVTDDGGYYKNSSIDKENLALLTKEMHNAFYESHAADYLHFVDNLD